MSSFFSDIAPLDKSVPGSAGITQVIFPQSDVLYKRRAERLRYLAKEQEDEGGYLSFLAHLNDFQARWLETHLLDEAEAKKLLNIRAADSAGQIASQLEKLICWQIALREMADYLGKFLPDVGAEKLSAFMRNPSSSHSEKAAALLTKNYADIDSGIAIILWAALSISWVQAVFLRYTKKNNTNQIADTDEGGASCPCCGFSPSGGLVLTGDREGLRYLQCSLCEARWHKVRAVCSACSESQHIDYWTFEKTDSPVQIETCGDCHHYIKIFRLDRDFAQDVLADDLLSQDLDRSLEEQRFKRTGINPYFFV